METYTIESFKTAIKSRKILKKYGLKEIGFFGSFARGESSQDIDVFLDIDTYEIDKILQLKEELESISNKEIDLVLKKYANPIILYRAQKDMIYVTEQEK